MSYATVDHAGWVERNIAASKSMLSARKRRADNTRGWSAAPECLSPFQAKVMDILGMVGGGIYNAPIAWDGVQWRCGRGIAVPWRRHGGLSTFDFSELTRLVFLCHAARIRCCINVHGPSHFLLMFHPRSHHGAMGERHPNLDEAVADFRAYLPADHRILYREEEPA